MRRPGGYAVISDPQQSQPVLETDTFTCGHCQKIVPVPPRCDPADLGGLCKVCMRLVCPVCHGQGSCTPFEKRIEQQEAKGRMLRSMGL